MNRLSLSRPSLSARLGGVAPAVALCMALCMALGLAGAASAQTAPATTPTAATGAAPAAARPTPRADGVRLEPLSGDYVTVGRTNLRQQPNQQGTRLGQIETGVRLRVTGKVAGVPWYAVTREDGRSGYVFADLLRPVAEPAPAAAAPATPAATAPAATAPAAAAPASAPAADPVTTALNERLGRMDAALADIRKQLGGGEAAPGITERQQALESAIAALRNDVAGLRGAAAEGDKPGGFMDRLIGLQEQISAQIAEQKADLEKLAKRLDATEEWLKPMKEWSQQTLDGMRPSESWMDWLWNGYAATRTWLTEGWWWQAPAAETPPLSTRPPTVPDATTPNPVSNDRPTIMG